MKILFCLGAGGPQNGSYRCVSTCWQSHHRLHQSRRHRQVFPADKVLEVLNQTGRTSVRESDLPAHVVVYYVIALALYMRSSYRELLRCLLEGVQWLLDPSSAVKVAGKSGIAQGLSRLGAEPLKKLHAAMEVPIAESRTKGAGYRQ
jgi:hypothetical protein